MCYADPSQRSTRTYSCALAFYIVAGIMIASAVVAFIARPPKRGARAGAPQAEEARA